MADLVSVETSPCMVCGQHGTVDVPEDGLNEWIHKGVHIQDALPGVDRSIREQLLTGTHPECWQEMFSPDEEEEP